MASTAINPVTTLITGGEITAGTTVASSQTCTITATTAQGALDFATLAVRVTNTCTTTACVLTLNAGATAYSGIGAGDSATIALGSNTTIIIGGQTFESARYLKLGAQSIQFTQTSGTGPTSWEAYQAPRASE